MNTQPEPERDYTTAAREHFAAAERLTARMDSHTTTSEQRHRDLAHHYGEVAAVHLALATTALALASKDPR